MSYPIQKLVQVATLYYKSGNTQQEIAEKMNISRQTVINMLTEAKEQKIVEITIHNPLKESKQLSQQLIDKFNLKGAVVMPYSSFSDDLMKDILASRATSYVSDLIENGNKKIGIGWGRTIYSFITLFEPKATKNTIVFPLMGATDKTTPFFMSNELVRNFAEKITAKTQYAYIPANPSNSEDAKLFRKTSAYIHLSSLWSDIDIAIVGLGINPSIDELIRERYPGENAMKISDYIAGDISTNYFNINGDFIDISSDMLHASHTDLSKAKRVVAIAGGLSKYSSILGALKTGIITDIITDMETCSKILKENK